MKKEESLCVAEELPISKYTCPCQEGLQCYPAAVTVSGYDGLGVCYKKKKNRKSGNKKSKREEETKKKSV
jgi:hypothetical protein